MEQFSLEKWLQDKSRKVVTRDGREVELYYSPTSRISLIGRTSDNYIYQYTKDGFQCDIMNQAKNDLFFADEEEELTKFDYAVLSIISDHNSHTDSIEVFAKRSSKKLLDLARKEIEKDIEEGAIEFAKSYMEDANPSFEKIKESEELWKWKMSCLRGINKAYRQGKQDSLKELPKWKRATEDKKFDKHVCVMDYYMVPFLDTEVNEGDYYIELSDLKTLPKEE